MSGQPDFLPPMLQLDGKTYQQMVELLYSVFERDCKHHQTRHGGVPVYYNNRIEPDGLGKEEGFWHVVEREGKDRDSRDRLPDPRRSEKLPWARPIMESATRPEITIFNYDEGTKNRGIRRYIWLERFDYLVILQPKKNNFFWVSAFHVDERNRAYFARKYAGRVQNSNRPYC